MDVINFGSIIKTYIMKKALLILLAIVLVAGINNLKAQEEKKKIEKNINVEEKNGEITITITETEGDKVTKKVLTGEEAEEYLENQHKGHGYSYSEGEEGERVIVMEMKKGDGESFVWVSEEDMEFEMDFDIDELEKELEELREELDELDMDEVALRLDEIIEMKEEMHKVHVIKMENLHQEMGELMEMEELMEIGEIDVTVEEKDGVMIITKTVGDTKTVEEIIIDEDNKGKHVYVINSTTGEKHESHANSDDLNMNVYPTPNNGNFTIDLELKTDETASVKVVDSNGKEVYSRSVQGVEKHELKVKLKKPSPGAYVIIVEQGNTKMKLKTIIE